MNSSFLVFAVAAGVAFALQGPINAGLARYVSGPIAASFVAHVVGSCVTGLAFFAIAAVRGSRLSALWSAPSLLYLGGCFSAFGIIVMTFVVPRLGVASTVSAIIFGQLACALAADQFGWFGVSPIPTEPRRIAGAVAMVLAVWLLRR